MNTTEINSLPRHAISLRKCGQPIDVVNFFRKHKISGAYLYSFAYKTVVMKFGSSSGPRKSSLRPSMYGERVYRQAGHILGWVGGCHTSSAGADMGCLVADKFPTCRKNDVTITIYDATNYAFTVLDNPSYDLERAENNLISAHELILGRSPAGNIKDMSFASNRACVPDNIVNQLFEIK
tara:strand:+ start:6023 stop:6562 length:540 start_codon:yes stop_codon:yes gene_type:complete